MAQEMDAVERYGRALGLRLRPRTIIVEGTTDVGLFSLAAKLESRHCGVDLLGEDLAIVAGGARDSDGTRAVVEELVALRRLARTCLLPDGRPRYRIVGLFDNDAAGKQAVKLARNIDVSIIEYKDIFRLWPVMPHPGNIDPGTVRAAFDRENAPYAGLDWALEDLLSCDFIDGFAAEFPSELRCRQIVQDRIHYELTPNGKAHLHSYVKDYAVRKDLQKVIEALRSLRCCLGLRS